MVVVDVVPEDEEDDGWLQAVDSSFVFIDKLSGASSDDVPDVLGLPINELTSKAKGLPLTVWLRALVPLLMLLLLLTDEAPLELPVPGRRSS